MRILSVVTLISPLGEYGGPVRVAVNQAKALAARGHDVTIAGSARGFEGDLPTMLEGVHAVLEPARTLLPRIGFAGVGSPGLWSWARRHVADFDVVHVHVARDLVTLPIAAIARRRGVPYVLQTHGMIDRSTNPLARPLDAALTRRVLRDARRVLHLTEVERLSLIHVAGAGLALEELPNGVPVADVKLPSGPARVLYLARLAPRKRPGVFVAAATVLSPEFPDVRFALVGPDEGEGEQVAAAVARARGAGVQVEWEGPLPPEQTAERMGRSTIYVLPSVDEPYPMSVLEAMASGLPVVITETCGLASVVREASAGVVVDHSEEALIGAVRQLLANAEAARAMGRSGQRFVRNHLSMGVIAVRLEAAYSR
ncbi:glycosyltransferase [Aeromicrobium sp.]|uniref:glycosyltransferase n=1 Tax=Aeromicrobium sp. TaxID=1871063 RepID=UPI0019CC37F9|nr:glycosyltransferase [Aeromicrobium sp.]MBC7632274.1 glycosyltransferase [Aeromicrobium sp.]